MSKYWTYKCIFKNFISIILMHINLVQYFICNTFANQWICIPMHLLIWILFTLNSINPYNFFVQCDYHWFLLKKNLCQAPLFPNTSFYFIRNFFREKNEFFCLEIPKHKIYQSRAVGNNVTKIKREWNHLH